MRRTASVSVRYGEEREAEPEPMGTEREEERLTGRGTDTPFTVMFITTVTYRMRVFMMSVCVSYPVIVGGVSQSEALHLQNEHTVIELNEVDTFLLS